MITDNEMLICAAKKNYANFKVPTCCVESKKIIRSYTPTQKADLDIKTSKNSIGEIINFSQELNSRLWNNINGGQTARANIELYCDICTLSVMSGLAIDAAKREFEVDLIKELKRLKEKYVLYDENGKKIRPYFFQPLAKYKGYYKKNGGVAYKKHSTTMDYVQQCLNAFRLPRSAKTCNYIPFSDIIDLKNYNAHSVKYDQVRRVLDEVRKARMDIADIWKDPLSDRNTKLKLWYSRRYQCFRFVGDMRMSKHTMYRLLLSIEEEQNRDISACLMNILFRAPNKSFYKLLKQSERAVKKIVPYDGGHIRLYGMRYE